MPSHLHATLPFLLNRIAARVTDAVNREFAPMGLNIFAVRVLILLHQDGAMTVGELAEQASLDQSTLSHILRRLQGEDLLVKERLEHDNRSVKVTLTHAGSKLAPQCWAAVKAHDTLIRKGLERDQVNVLTESLKRMNANVPAFGNRSAHAAKKAAATAHVPPRREPAA